MADKVITINDWLTIHSAVPTDTLFYIYCMDTSIGHLSKDRDTGVWHMFLQGVEDKYPVPSEVEFSHVTIIKDFSSLDVAQQWLRRNGQLRVFMDFQGRS